jgi:hypothetical protein
MVHLPPGTSKWNKVEHMPQGYRYSKKPKADSVAITLRTILLNLLTIMLASRSTAWSDR